MKTPPGPRKDKVKSSQRSAGRKTHDPRTAALHLLNGVLRQGRAIDENFDAAAEGLEDRDRGFARLVLATTLRRLGQIDDVLNKFLEHEPPALTLDVLRLSAAQILFIGTPAHAAVATGVEAIKNSVQQNFSGLVNAVLRRVTEQGPALIAAQKAGWLNTPAWMYERWIAQYGETGAAQLADAHLVEAPVDLSLKDDATAADWSAQLSAEVLPTGALRLKDANRIPSLPGFDDGAWWVQDAAAALPARILLQAMGAHNGKRVADLCAAPGGKTMQLAAAGCDVTAVDASSKRLQRVRENLNRVKLNAKIITADTLTWKPAELFDAVLLDAPCSSSGTIRRHPDLPYLKSASSLPHLAARQRDMLRAALRILKPGGVLVYSVCSLEEEEGEGVVDSILADHENLTREPVPTSAIGGVSEFLTARGDLRTLPSHWAARGGIDGFYAALIRKQG